MFLCKIVLSVLITSIDQIRSCLMCFLCTFKEAINVSLDLAEILMRGLMRGCVSDICQIQMVIMVSVKLFV